MLEYNDYGHGPVVLLIHGFLESKELWQGFDLELANQFRVIVPDLPGFGESRFTEDSLSIEYFAECIHELLNILSVEKCVMIGHSLGGYVTLAFAEKYEHKVSGIGLFHSTAFEDSIEKKANRNRIIKFIEKHGVAAFANSSIPPLFPASSRETYKEEIANLIRIASSSSQDAVIETVKAMRDRKERIDLLKKITIPVFFIIGKEDSSVSLEKSLAQCYIPTHHVVHILENTGHMGMIESKLETIAITREFIRFVVSG
jgi:pimeloyl-ACP methyl ester carboxylesterase